MTVGPAARTRSAQALLELLDRELVLLRRSDVDGLERLARDKLRLLEHLKTRRPPATDAIALQERLVRNATHFEAAHRGTGAALKRIDAIRQAAGPIRGYAASGEPQSIGMDPRAVERRL